MDSPDLLATSDEFKALTQYTNAFDMFRVMGISHKELVHSNILAALFNSNVPHGMDTRFRDAYLSSLSDCVCIGEPLTAELLSSTRGMPAKVARELEHIDVLLDFPTLRLVVAIENKIWAVDQADQVARYQQALCDLYPHYTHRVLVYLTPKGRTSPTLDKNSAVPVYLQSYGQLAALLRQQQPCAAPSAAHFMGELATHMEKTMSGNSEIRELCWNVFDQHETAYRQMVKNLEYCVTRKLEGLFDSLEKSLPCDPLFSQWAGQIETRQRRKHEENWFALDIRLAHWPAGVWVKIFKHNMFGVFPYFRSADLDALKVHLPAFTLAPKAIAGWNDHYAASSGFASIEDRRVLGKGDEVTEADVRHALAMARGCVVDIESELSRGVESLKGVSNLEAAASSS